jgi:putative hydrolase of the HAD superfamily
MAISRNAMHGSPLDGRLAVTFDAGFTLVEPYPSVGAVYDRVARGLGIESPGVEALERRFYAAYQSRKEQAIREWGNAEFSAGEERSRMWWSDVTRETFGDYVRQNESKQLFERLYEEFASARCWRLYPDVMPTLIALRMRGIRMAVVSNWDRRLRQTLGELGVAPFFETLCISSEVGAEKPHAPIFRSALDAFGLEPQLVLHLGDSLRDDYEGARAMGMGAILVERPGRPIDGASEGVIVRDLQYIIAQ